MSKRLIITEKPSVGKQLAQFLDATSAAKGYLEGPYDIVTWCFGHLLQLRIPDEYCQNWGRPWRSDVLPMIPNRFENVVKEDSKKQLHTISQLISRDDVSTIVHACDPDREGEAILRKVLAYTGCKKPVQRLWATSMEDGALAKAFDTLQPLSDYDGLADAARGRDIADWLVGMNATRALTCTYKRMVHAGRVTSPTLHLITQRTRDHDSFSVTPFWQLQAKLACGCTLLGEHYNNKERIDLILDECAGHDVTIMHVENQTKRKNAPKLYDLTSLQRDASTYFGMSAADTLDAMQALYEAKLGTYPRTDSRYVTDDDIEEVDKLLQANMLENVLDIKQTGQPKLVSKQVANNAKVNGHCALLPTRLLTQEVYERLPAAQQNIAKLLICRLSVSCAPTYEAEFTKISAEVSGYPLQGNVSQEIIAGWQGIQRSVLRKDKANDEEDTKTLPRECVDGAVLAATIEVKQGKTRAPELYTDATLLSAMENADKLVEDKELASALRDDSTSSSGLGTPATRANTIEGLITAGYVARRGKSLVATDEGFTVDELIPPSLATPELTASWETQLADIEHGRVKLDDFIDSMKLYTDQLICEIKEDFNPEKVAVRNVMYAAGVCPRCGQNVVKSKSGTTYYCSSRKGHIDKDTNTWVVDDEGCGFWFSSTVCGYRLTDAQVKRILDGKTVQSSRLKTNSGEKFAAGIVLDAYGKFGTKLVFKSFSPKQRSSSKERKLTRKKSGTS